MSESKKVFITVQTTVQASAEKAWQYWTEPERIEKWNAASADWHTPYAENDLRIGGKFLYRMEAKDGSAGFDFTGIYDRVKSNEEIQYTMVDGRKAEISFIGNGNETRIIETFEAEHENSIEQQQKGWQSILDNFKNYIENY